MLQRFALFDLHAERFVIGGAGARAVDAFVLRGATGAEPSPECVTALRNALAACLPRAARRAL